MVRRTRLNRGYSKRKTRIKRVGTLSAIMSALTSGKIRKKLESRKNYADYSILYKPKNTKDRNYFRKTIEKQIKQVYPNIKFKWTESNGFNDFRVYNATLSELIGVHTVISTMAIGGFKY